MKYITVVFFLSMLYSVEAKIYTVASPDKRIVVTVNTDEQMVYSVTRDGKSLLDPSAILLQINNIQLGNKSKPIGSIVKEINEIVDQPFGKYSKIIDHCNELSIRFKENFTLQFRAYNNGVAYRFITGLGGKVTVNNEVAEFVFSGNYEVVYPFEENPKFLTPQETQYLTKKIQDIPEGHFFWPPVMIRTGEGIVLAVTESDLLDYAGMYLQRSAGNKLSAVFPRYPKTEKPGGWNDYNMLVEDREDFIASTTGLRNYPWRLIAIEEKEIGLIENDLVYLLASPSQIGDISWIKPGKVAWDWWCNWNLDNVTFQTGMNTQTFKYFIDFAADYKLEYIILDEGWSSKDDLTKPVSAVDIPALVNYGKQKNVQLILWCPWHTMDIQMNVVLEQFEKWGIAGLKIDFMDRDDQKMVNFYERIAKACAEKKLLIDFHGAYKPTGMRRTYPNVLNREGVMGAEYNKWSDRVTAEHNVTIPFTRMFAGPMDYTPGSMRNVKPGWFKPVFEKPMTMTNRSQQLAMFIVYYAPLQMLSDAPTAYEREPDITSFIASVPVVWDETRGIEGRCGEYLVITRRKGDIWFAAGMNGLQKKSVLLDLSFLGPGNFSATIFKDGINSAFNPTDTEKLVLSVSSQDQIKIDMLEGGGFAIRFDPVK